jgi:hypothetical protein
MDGARHVVVIGVDPHNRSVTIEARDAPEVLRATGSFPTTTPGYRAMLRYCRQWPRRVWAVEGAGGVGRPLAARLLAEGERVLDVPARRAHGNRCGQFLVEAELTPGGRQGLRARSSRGDLQIAALPADRPYGPDTGRGPSLRQAPRSLDDHPELADRPPHEPTRHPNALEPGALGRTPGREFPHPRRWAHSRPQRGRRVRSKRRPVLDGSVGIASARPG